MNVKVGTRVRLHTAQGRMRLGADNKPELDTEDEGHLPAGSEGVIVAIVPGDVSGVGDNTKEHAAIRFGPEEHGAEGQRHWSYPTDALEEVFEIVTKTGKKETE
jgi:hypothetical protein